MLGLVGIIMHGIALQYMALELGMLILHRIVR